MPPPLDYTGLILGRAGFSVEGMDRRWLTAAVDAIVGGAVMTERMRCVNLAKALHMECKAAGNEAWADAAKHLAGQLAGG